MIPLNQYQLRRQRLAQNLESGSIALISSGNELIRNKDVHYRFRADSDFYYLTGFNEPQALLLIIAGESGESYLFNQSRDLEAELWAGPRLGQENAPYVLGVKEAFPIKEVKTRLLSFLVGKSAIYYAICRDIFLDGLIRDCLQILKGQTHSRHGVNVFHALFNIDILISEMRLFKSEFELTFIRRAVDVSVDAHKRAMHLCHNLLQEHELEAEIIYELNRHGCRNMAYDPIVGGGANACILHYTDNNCPLNKGELVLVDAGGEFENYAADITRTFPINGVFNSAQQDIYALVLNAQKAGISCIKPGVSWSVIQETMLGILIQGLCDLKILQGDVQTLIESGAYKTFYPHSSGHWLGLDVHDSGAYKIDNQWRILAPGMVLTVEPGIYIRNIPEVDAHFRNIGVRIEDDILVTQDAYENLSRDLPVEIGDIEALMRD